MIMCALYILSGYKYARDGPWSYACVHTRVTISYVRHWALRGRWGAGPGPTVHTLHSPGRLKRSVAACTELHGLHRSTGATGHIGQSASPVQQSARGPRAHAREPGAGPTRGRGEAGGNLAWRMRTGRVAGYAL